MFSNGETTLFYFDFYIFISGMISNIYYITMVFELGLRRKLYGHLTQKLEIQFNARNTLLH